MLRRRTLKVDAPPRPGDEPAVDDMHKLPPSTAWRRIDFERAEIRTLESFPPQHILVVRGLKPFLNMEVDLEPVVYIRQPEYWEIEVLGRLRGPIGLTAVEPYTVTLPLAGVTGTRGVEVMGANKSMRLDLLPGQHQALAARRLAPSSARGGVLFLRALPGSVRYTARPMGAPLHLVSFGEAMVRLCPPGFGRLEMATALEMQPGGAELNTAVGLARLGAEAGLGAAWVSRLPRNALGRYLAAKGREHGVVTDHIVWDDDPDARCGTYFLEEGAAPRASAVLYDRANSACARLRPEEIAWPSVLRGVRYFLVTGITPALSAGCLEATRQAMRAARDAGARVVFDPNFRSKLWTAQQAREVYLELAPLVDILSCPAEGLRFFYGIEGDDPAPARWSGSICRRC